MGVARTRLTILFVAAYLSALMYGIVWGLTRMHPPLDHNTTPAPIIEPNKDT